MLKKQIVFLSAIFFIICLIGCGSSSGFEELENSSEPSNEILGIVKDGYLTFSGKIPGIELSSQKVSLEADSQITLTPKIFKSSDISDYLTNAATIFELSGFKGNKYNPISMMVEPINITINNPITDENCENLYILEQEKMITIIGRFLK